MKDSIYQRFCSVVGKEFVSVNEPMKYHTTFRIGGGADYFLSPGSPEELRKLLHICKEEHVPYYIMGNGSNLLVSDHGYRGAVIQIYKNMNRLTVEDKIIRAQAGIQLSALANKALESGLTGLEFASGIPGTQIGRAHV